MFFLLEILQGKLLHPYYYISSTRPAAFVYFVAVLLPKRSVPNPVDHLQLFRCPVLLVRSEQLFAVRQLYFPGKHQNRLVWILSASLESQPVIAAPRQIQIGFIGIGRTRNPSIKAIQKPKHVEHVIGGRSSLVFRRIHL